jgi:hypothetical protein
MNICAEQLKGIIGKLKALEVCGACSIEDQEHNCIVIDVHDYAEQLEDLISE